MLGTIYNGLSGMEAFSQGLDNVSNNVANLNTPGYKRADLAFRDAFYRVERVGGGSCQIGSGSVADRTSINFAQGELRETGGETDAAIDGNGFFIIRDDGTLTLTRAGEFSIDGDGFLVLRQGNGRIAGIDDSGRLCDIGVEELRVDPAAATENVTFFGNLSLGSSSHVVAVTVYDAIGKQHELTVTFTNRTDQTPDAEGAAVWIVDVEDTQGNALLTGAEIRFQPNASPAEGLNEVSFEFQGDGEAPSTISLNFGEPGGFSKAISFLAGTTSDLTVDAVDGHGIGALARVEFGENGTLSLSYSNGEEREGPKLAIALPKNSNGLIPLGNSRFAVADEAALMFGPAAEGGAGKVLGGRIELSNVELTEQFTDMIIIQRGYQASSQVLTTANELLQQLINMNRGG